MAPSLQDVVNQVFEQLSPKQQRVARFLAANEVMVAFTPASELALRQQPVLPLIVDALPATIELALASLAIATLIAIPLGCLSALKHRWGNMLNDSRQYLRQAWWLATFPGLAISLLVLAVNLLGDGLRDALDPRQRGR